MIITKQLFEKLNKKSKEEYKKRIDKVREINPPMIWINYTYGFIYFIMFMFVIIPLWKLAFGWEVIRSLFVLMSLGVKIFGLLFVIGIGIDIAVLMIRINKINQIIKDYFEVKVKDEKSNRNNK